MEVMTVTTQNILLAFRILLQPWLPAKFMFKPSLNILEKLLQLK